MILKGRVAFVTGARRGIGRAIALELAHAGAAVALGDNQGGEEFGEVQSEILSLGEKAIICGLDVTSRKSIREAVKRTKKQLGPIDILVNNAGIHNKQDFLKITDKDWDYLFSVNLKGAFMCIQEALPDMLRKKSGKIINIASIAGERGGIHAVHYAAAKAGLINLTRSMARLYSSYNVQTYCIAPGIVKTVMSVCVDANREIESIPAKRIAQPSEIAKGALFLCTSGADYMTGQTLNYNGGEYFGV